jgi:ABC-type glutathione transport system ATPase component
VSPDEEVLLEGRSVSKCFRVARGRVGGQSFSALDDVSISVRAGEIVGVVGESGSGKSTLGKILIGLMRPDSGEVLFRGAPLTTLAGGGWREYRRSVQAVFQNPLRSFNPMWTIGKTLREASSFAQHSSRTPSWAAEELLEQVGLGREFATRRPSQMSGGELQRAAIARALATDPALIFLDEPTSALDVSVRGQVINLLLELHERRSLAILWVTHELAVVRATADRVVVMRHGNVIEEGPAAAVFGRPVHAYTQALCDTAIEVGAAGLE